MVIYSSSVNKLQIIPNNTSRVLEYIVLFSRNCSGDMSGTSRSHNYNWVTVSDRPRNCISTNNLHCEILVL